MTNKQEGEMNKETLLKAINLAVETGYGIEIGDVLVCHGGGDEPTLETYQRVKGGRLVRLCTTKNPVLGNWNLEWIAQATAEDYCKCKNTCFRCKGEVSTWRTQP